MSNFEQIPNVQQKLEEDKTVQEEDKTVQIEGALKDRFIESGIADKLLTYMKEHKGTLDPEITFGVNDCNFSIERKNESSDPEEQEMYTQIIVEHPNLHPLNKESQPMVTMAFDPAMFGATGFVEEVLNS
jgi:hypothetical protein